LQPVVARSTGAVHIVARCGDRQVGVGTPCNIEMLEGYCRSTPTPS